MQQFFDFFQRTAAWAAYSQFSFSTQPHFTVTCQEYSAFPDVMAVAVWMAITRWQKKEYYVWRFGLFKNILRMYFYGSFRVLFGQVFVQRTPETSIKALTHFLNRPNHIRSFFPTSDNSQPSHQQSSGKAIIFLESAGNVLNVGKQKSVNKQ